MHPLPLDNEDPMRPVSITFPQTPDGWQIELQSYIDPKVHDPQKKPILFIPGYGMNSHILANHPTSESIIEHLCSVGFAVWAANLRGQGAARRVGGPRRISLNELVCVDIPVAIEAVLRESGASSLIYAGCSLGAAIGYGYLAHNPRDHGLEAMVALGGPFRWENPHPLVSLLARAPGVVGAVPIKGTRRMAKAGLAIARKVPAFISPYMNARAVNLTNPAQLVPGVDDPTPYLNRQLAHWIAARDLVVGGVHVTSAIQQVEDVDLLCIFANRDGIVPPETALSVLDYIEAGRKDVIQAGDEQLWFAHADLFVSAHARSVVFEQMAEWLLEHTR